MGMRAAGDMSHAKCLYECKKESTCIALETGGWKKKSGQYGSCYLFGRNPDSRQKEITNGGCDSSGNIKCYGKLDKKEVSAIIWTILLTWLRTKNGGCVSHDEKKKYKIQNKQKINFDVLMLLFLFEIKSMDLM